jgi:hypothetical protein
MKEIPLCCGQKLGMYGYQTTRGNSVYQIKVIDAKTSEILSIGKPVHHLLHQAEEQFQQASRMLGGQSL